MTPIFRIDDIGASTKHFNQHGKKHVKLFGKIPFYFPFANVGFFKRVEPFRGWAVYDELTVNEWKDILMVFKEHSIVPIIAVTATWVERDGMLTPFPQKFPGEALLLKEALHRGEIMIANHGLTHCVVGKHLPRFWSSNRKYQREFLPELPKETHREHIVHSQDILESYFERPIDILVPPGNLWSIKTYQALHGTNITKVMCNRYMRDSDEPMHGIDFIPDTKDMAVFHDRELKLYGTQWLREKIKSVM
jgi:hypothetical protein